jgi:hypothetical protein
MKKVRESFEFSQIYAVKFDGPGFNLSVSKFNFNFILVLSTSSHPSIEHFVTIRHYNDMIGNIR